MSVDDSFFDVIGPPQAWVLGLLASDGCISNGGISVSFGQSGDHGRELVAEVARLLAFDGAIRTYATAGRDAHSIFFTSRSSSRGSSR